jgi:hypothetical protein
MPRKNLALPNIFRRWQKIRGWATPACSRFCFFSQYLFQGRNNKQQQLMHSQGHDYAVPVQITGAFHGRTLQTWAIR